MVFTALVTPLLVLCALALVVWRGSAGLTIAIFIALAIGVATALAARNAGSHAQELSRERAPELHAIVERLCLAGDLPRPRVMLDRERQPNSWLVHHAGRDPELHVTSALLETLPVDELEAVVAHELSHLAHRDARVMTVVGGPGSVLLQGGQGMMAWPWFGFIGGMVAMGIGGLSRVGTSALSRYRELAADRDSAALTGRPASLASALRRLSGELARMPTTDLRAAAGRNAFQLLPVGAEGGGRWWVGDTHPPLAKRLAQLDALERRMHQARAAAPRELAP
jgi:heat shock protein HtpX